MDIRIRNCDDFKLAWQFLGVVTDVYPNRLLQAIALLSTQYSR
ncbi:MAG: hypothetical protein RIG66_23245 [Coleofasciculus sp. E2-BRE-01]